MSVVMFPGPRAPTRLSPAEEQARRDRVLDAQCDVLDLVQRHRNLGVAGDVELLAALLGYLSTANGMQADVMAIAAVSSQAVHGPGVRH